MKFLIAVGSKTYSEPTLRVGMQVAKAFNASVTILYVGPKISAFSSSEVRLAQESMERWEIDRPGVEVLEWAFNFLASHDYITPKMIEAGFQKNTLVQTRGNRCELYLQGVACEDVNLILRNGDIIPELRDEVAKGGYDVTIIGGSKKRRMAHDLVQYIDSSIFVVKNFEQEIDYRLLMATDDSEGTKKAVKFGAKVSQAFDMSIDLLTVSKKNFFGKGYRNASKKASTLVRRAGIEGEVLLKVGDPVEVIVDFAGNDHIIVMGASSANPVKKFLFGSKPLKVMSSCNCPILIVK